jgi:NAD(P)-dependent dehydrogenase (short-subunit alcohol dehydrogenase family)
VRSSGGVSSVGAELRYLQAGDPARPTIIKDLPAYATTKAAVLMLTECLRAELASSGIGVTAVCPGVVATNITRATRYFGVGAEQQELLRERVSAIYQRRNFTPERVAALPG